MAEGFKIADAYVEVTTRIDDGAVSKAAALAGDAAGEEIGTRASQTSSKAFERDARGRFLPAAQRTGSKVGEGLGKSSGDGFDRQSSSFFGKGGKAGSFLGKGLSGAFGAIANGASGIGSIVSKAAINPYALAGMAAAGATLAPLLSAAISGGLIAGAGAGVIGLGYMLLKEEPAVKAASKKLGDTVKTTFTTAAKPLIPFFVEAMGIIQKTVKDLGPDLKTMFSNVGPAIKPLTEGLMGLVKNLMPGLLDLTKQVAPLFEDLKPAFEGLGKSISTALSLFASTSGDAGLALGDLIGFIGGAIVQTAMFLAAMAKGYSVVRTFFVETIPAAIATTIEWFKKVGRAISDWASGVANWFSGAASSTGTFFSNIWASITGFFSNVGSWFAALPGKFMGWLSSVWSTISTWGTNVGNFFMALPGRIGAFLASLPGILLNAFTTALHGALYAVGYAIGSIVDFFIKLPGRAAAAASALWGAISSAFTTARDNSIAWIRSAVTAVVNFFTALPGRARSAVSTLWSGMVGIWNTAKTSAINIATALVNSVVNFFKTLPGKARSAVSSLWSSMVGAFNSAVSAAKEKATSLVNGTVSFLKTLPGKAKSAISGIKSSILGVFSGASSWLVSAGANILKGLASGIKSAVGAAVGAAKSAVGSVIKGAKDALGIASPSKVAAKQVGRWIPPGITKGVMGAIPAARMALARAIEKIIPPKKVAPRLAPSPTEKKLPWWAAPAIPKPVTNPTAGILPVRNPSTGGDSDSDSGSGTVENHYNFYAGAIQLDVSKVRTIRELIDLIESLRISARGYAS